MPKFKDITVASGQVATHSAMNPILWATVVCSPVGMISSAIAPLPLAYFILALSSLPLIVCCLGFAYFAVKDPDRLQSEPHLQQMAQSRIGDNRTNTQTTVGTSQTVSNPGENQ